jgi:RNA polymerase sigma factor (TIGR02999 family)
MDETSFRIYSRRSKFWMIVDIAPLFLMTDVTRILSQIESGDPLAAAQLLPIVYDELRKMAAAKLAQEKPGQTLQATALVHEAYLRLIGKNHVAKFESQKHFFGAAAEAMRRILVDEARRKQTVRYGGDRQRIPELPDVPDHQQQVGQTLAVDALIDKLAEKHPRQAEVGKMRLFLEMSFSEIAEVVGISVDSVENDWKFARAWLRREWCSLDKNQ